MYGLYCISVESDVLVGYLYSLTGLVDGKSTLETLVLSSNFWGFPGRFSYQPFLGPRH